MKLLKIICTLFIFVSTIFPQQKEIWKNYTDYRSVSDVVITNDGLWGASSGGAFYHNLHDKTYQQLNMINNGNLIAGISKLTAIAVDNQGKVWMGNEDGFVDVYNPQNNSFKRIFEISNYTESEKKNITGISIAGDSVFVSTAFGLSVINANDYSFNFSTIKFGTFNTNIIANSIYLNKLVYVSTESGIARQINGKTNLSAPESWEVFSAANGLPSNMINMITAYNDTILACTDHGISKLVNNQWITFIPQLNGKNIVSVAGRNDSLFIISKTNIYNNNNKLIHIQYDYHTYTAGILTTLLQDCGYKKLFINKNSAIYAATENGILNVSNNEYLFPDGPKSNKFINLDVDASGNLWVATGKDNQGVGINKFNGSNWKNFDAGSNGLLMNDIWKVYAAPDNKVYAGTWGRGFVRIVDDKTTNFSADNAGLIGIPKDLSFVVVHGFNTDSKGNLWVVNFWSNNNQTLNKLSTDSVWEHFNNPLIPNSSVARELVIDQNDTKWFTVGDNEDPSGKGLQYFNEEQSLYTSDVNGWGQVTLSSTQPSITSIALDRRGELWVGTSEGVYIIDDPGVPKSTIEQFTRPLSTHSISAIAVDALNQKWVGTQDGIYLLSPDGTQVIQNYNTSNSPLLDNAITSIALDDNTGTVYAGTNFGLSSLSTLAVNPKDDFSGLTVFPNPVYLDGSPVNINIDGLIRDTDIKILSISGNLIRTFSSPGGRKAEWDGKDDFGRIVSSGVYIVIAYDKDGNNVGTAKLAVIRK